MLCLTDYSNQRNAILKGSNRHGAQVKVKVREQIAELWVSESSLFRHFPYEVSDIRTRLWWMEKTKRLLKDNLFESTEGKGNLALENQLDESFCSCSRIKAIDGRFDSRFSYSSNQLSCSRFHNPSENLAFGLSGRIPSITLFTTTASSVDFPNGNSPVSTCGHGQGV